MSNKNLTESLLNFVYSFFLLNEFRYCGYCLVLVHEATPVVLGKLTPFYCTQLNILEVLTVLGIN